ncbi:MAG: ABC transporter permease [Pseudomonadota bacterium]
MFKICWSSFLRSWRHNPTVQMTTLTVLSGTFFVMSAFALIHENLDSVLTRWGQEVQMTVFLDDDIDLANLEGLQSKIQGHDSVDKVTYVSKEDAARQFLNQMGTMAPEFLGDEKFGNPLPASLEVSLKAGLSKGSGIDRIVDLAGSLGSEKGVEDISYGQGWIENYASVVNQFGRSSWFVIFVLMAGSLLIVGNSIRNSVSQRREEIEVLELVGATATRIQAPFIFEGVLFGLIASVVATTLAYLVFQGQALVSDSSLQFLGLSTELQFLSISKVALILVFGATSGAVGSWLCVRSISTGWSAAHRQEQLTR